MIYFLILAPTDLDLLQLTMNRMQKAESDVRYLNSGLKHKVLKCLCSNACFLI